MWLVVCWGVLCELVGWVIGRSVRQASAHSITYTKPPKPINTTHTYLRQAPLPQRMPLGARPFQGGARRHLVHGRAQREDVGRQQQGAGERPGRPRAGEDFAVGLIGLCWIVWVGKVGGGERPGMWVGVFVRV